MSATKKELEAAEAVGKLLGWLVAMLFIFPLTTIYSVLATGYIISWMWVWFVVPLGVPAITLVHAWGLSAMIYIVSRTPSIYENENNKIDGGKVTAALLMPWITLLVGYILHGYVGI